MLTSLDLQEVATWVKAQVSDERWQHILGVVETASQLATRWQGNVEQAKLAAYLHDVMRDQASNTLLKMAEQSGIVIDDMIYAHPVLLHGPVAAVLARDRYNITNDVYNAIYYHTTARPGMSTLEKCIFLADAIEPNRVYPLVNQWRELAFNDLNQALLTSLTGSILYVIKKGEPLHTLTVKARNYCLIG